MWVDPKVVRLRGSRAGKGPEPSFVSLGRRPSVKNESDSSQMANEAELRDANDTFRL